MFTAAEILALVDTIYAGILDTTAWEAAIVEICRAIGGETAALALHDLHSHGVTDIVFVDIDQRYRRSYGDLIDLPDMQGAFRAVAEGAALGAVTGDHLAAAAPDFERSRFYGEWLRAQNLLDMIAAPLVPSPAVVGGLFIGRPRAAGGFGAGDLDALRLLRPHLVRAVQACLRLNGAMSLARNALAALDLVGQGVLLVDAGSGVVHANRAAEAALGQGDGLTAAHSALACDRADDTARLRRLVGEASAPLPEPGGRLAVRRRSGRRPLSVLVAPLRGERPSPRLGRPATAIVRGTGTGGAAARALRPDRSRGPDRGGAAEARAPGRRGGRTRRQPRHGAHPPAARVRQDRHPPPGRARAADAGA
jgi:PAS domain-containing protein